MSQKTIITPQKYAGKWIAWNEDHSKVLASGNTLAEVEGKAKKKNQKYFLDKIPSDQEFYVGSATLL